MWTLFAVLLSACSFCRCPAAAGSPIEPKFASKKFQNAIGQQSLHTVLVSIEERLRNLDSVYAMQYSPTIEGKLDHYIRKLESIEAKMARLEAVVSLEMDKISGNISSKNFKDDITKDHVLRKLNDVYDRMNHRLVYIELKIDMNEKKVEDKLETIISKLQKTDENILTGLIDVQTEMEDVLTGVDDIKASQLTVEDFMKNLTQESKVEAKEIMESFNKSCALHLDEIQRQQKTTEAQVAKIKDEYEDNFNEFSNKVADMHSDTWKKNEIIENNIKSLSSTLNVTRNEQQNGLRALMIQVGRKTAKPNVLSDPSVDQEKLTEIGRKIDANFENMMTAQNMFLESCHRVQMDESQLESKISLVLEKIIDTFERKTTFDPKLFKSLEHMLRTHDSGIKRNLFQIAGKLNALSHKSDDRSKGLMLKLEDLYKLLLNNNSSEFVTQIYGALRVFSGDLSRLGTDVRTQYNHSSEFNARLGAAIKEIQESLEESKGGTAEVLQKSPIVEPNNSSSSVKLDEETRELIAEIFGTGFKSSIEPKPDPLCLNIDVRFNGEDAPNNCSGNAMQIDIRSNFADASIKNASEDTLLGELEALASLESDMTTELYDSETFPDDLEM